MPSDRGRVLMESEGDLCSDEIEAVLDGLIRMEDVIAAFRGRDDPATNGFR